MDSFSERALRELGDNYVYGLMDPRNNQFFYIGKGTGNRVFDHEREANIRTDIEIKKLETIREIEKEKLEVEKVILNCNLTEKEAHAAEAALINALNYKGKKLTNIIAGHDFHEALSVDDFERFYGAEELSKEDIKHKILVIKINKLYRRDMAKEELYEAVRGTWRLNIEKARNAEYVFGVYKSWVVAVYKPTEWFVCKDAIEKMPKHARRKTEEDLNRKFFVDDNFDRKDDENINKYLYKSIAKLSVNRQAQNPISYLEPVKQD